MTGTIIEDGRGQGQKLQVDDHGRAYVLANTVSHPAHHASYHKDFFYAHHMTEVPGGSVETDCAIIEGINSSIELEVYSVLLTTDQNVLVSVYVDALYTSGGNVITAVNSNRTSNKTLEVGLYQGGAAADLVLNETNKQMIAMFHIPAYVPFLYPVDGTVILGNQKSLLFAVTAETATRIHLTTGLAPHPLGTKL